MAEAKTLLDIKMRIISYEEAKEMIANGTKLTPASLYEPEHAPKGTEFVQVVNKYGHKAPYRIRK